MIRGGGTEEVLALVPRRAEIGEQLLELVRAEGGYEAKLARIEGFALGLLAE